jgi:glycosyltransferase involved in cell wall biosynthesis
LRILQINSLCGVGSTGRIASDIHQLLKKQGHESMIAFGRNTRRYCTDAKKFGSAWNFLFHVAWTFATDRHGFASWLATRRLIRMIRDYNPDLVHLQVVHGYYVNIAMLFNELKRLCKPVVWTQHDCWAFTGHCAHFDYVGCDRWITGCHHCPEKGQYPISLLMDNSRRNYSDKRRLFNQLDSLTLVCPSKWLADLTRESFLKNHPVKVINNGVNLDVFKPRLSQIRENFNLKNKFVILAVATVWRERKGLNDLIRMAGHLEEDEIIIMVGLTKHQLRLLPSNIIGVMRTHDIDELAEFYSIADVFVNPTYEENFPTTHLEALACGTPIVTYQTGGSIESVDQSTGFIVQKGDDEEMLSKLRTIKALGKSSFSSACRNKAERSYDRNDKYQEYLDLYHELLDK